MSFAAIETMVNGGASALLANATLSYTAGVDTLSVDGNLNDNRNEPDAIGTPRGVRQVTFSLLQSALGGIVAGTPVTVRGVLYEVARVERDKSGWVTLHLRGGVA